MNFNRATAILALIISVAAGATPKAATYLPSGLYTTDPAACAQKESIQDLDNYFVRAYPKLARGKIYYLLVRKESPNMQLVYADNDLSCSVKTKAGDTLNLACESVGGEYPDATKNLIFNPLSRSITLDKQTLSFCE